MKRATTFLTATLLLIALGTTPFAQGTPAAKAPASEKKAAPKIEKAYVCEMCDFAGDKAGKCPKCGMNLREVDKADIYYECDMDHVKADKAGKCPKCGMNMTMKIKGDQKPAPDPHAGHKH